MSFAIWPMFWATVFVLDDLLLGWLHALAF